MNEETAQHYIGLWGLEKYVTHLGEVSRFVVEYMGEVPSVEALEAFRQHSPLAFELYAKWLVDEAKK